MSFTVRDDLITELVRKVDEFVSLIKDKDGLINQQQKNSAVP